jgi:ribosomal protein S6
MLHYHCNKLFVYIYMSFVFYETVCLLNPALNEDVLLKILDRYRGILVERGAKNIVVENKGKHRLKYPIKGFTEGVYVQMVRQVFFNHAQWEKEKVLDKLNFYHTLTIFN